MSNIKGITVEIGGNTTELNKALGQPIKESMSLQKELKEVDKLLKFDPGNVDLIAQKQQLLARNVEVSAQKVDILRQASEKMQAKLAEGMDIPIEQQRKLQRDLIQSEQIYNANTKAVDKYAGELSGVGEAAEKTGGKLGGLSGIVDKVANIFGVKLPPGITNAIKGFDDARASGDGLGGSVTDLAKNMGVELPGGLDKAVGGMGKFAAGAMAAAAVAGVLIKAMIDMSIAGAKAADELATNATIMGITNERYQEFAYMSELVDTSVDTIGNSMSKLTRSMSDAVNGTEKTQSAFKGLGVSYRDDLTGELRDNEEVFYDVIDALGRMRNETERDAVAMELLGKSARDLNPLIAAGGDEMRKLAQEAHEVGAVMSDEVVAGYAAMSDEMDRSKMIAEGLKNTIGSVMAPMLTKVFETINNLIATVSSALNGSQMIKFLQDLWGIIGTLIQAIGDLLMPILEGLYWWLEKLFAVCNLILAPIAYLITLIGNFIGLITGRLDWDSFVKSSEEATERLVKSWNNSIDSIIGKNDELKDSAEETGKVVGGSFEKAFGTGAAAAEKEYETIADINEKIKKSNEELKKSKRSLWTTVEDESGKLWRVHKYEYELYEQYADYIEEHYGYLDEKQKVYLAKRLDTEMQGAGSLKLAVEKANAQRTKLDEQAMKQNGLAAGQNFTDGVSEGIYKGLSKVRGSTQDVVNAIKSEIVNGLGIHSPSREGFKWGAFTLGGFIQGFESMRNKLNSSLADTLGTISGGMSGASLATPVSGGTIINQSFVLQADRFKDVNQLLDSASRAQQDKRAKGRR